MGISYISIGTNYVWPKERSTLTGDGSKMTHIKARATRELE